jgi:membrane protein involved in colicin uptake
VIFEALDTISYVSQQAQDEASRKAAQEAEKKALAEAQANKEKKHRASLKAAQKSRRLEKLDNSIKHAKEAKMPST